MSKGQRDFGLYAPTETIVGLSDLGELAARLGSINTHDRHGNVVWLDDFESGIEKWRHYSVAGDESLVWSPTRARNGGFCAKLSTDSHTDDDARAWRYLTYPILSKMGIEVSVSWGVYLKTFILHLILDNGTAVLEAKVRWTKNTKTWACWTINNKWQDLTPVITLRASEELFHTFKMVCDFPNSKYIKLIVNNTVFDLSAFTIQSMTPATAPFLRPQVEICTPSNHASEIYFDDVIVTQNEP